MLKDKDITWNMAVKHKTTGRIYWIDDEDYEYADKGSSYRLRRVYCCYPFSIDQYGIIHQADGFLAKTCYMFRPNELTKNIKGGELALVKIHKE